MALPTLTPQQRAAALEKAAVARKTRAEFKNDVSSGAIAPTDALDTALEHDILRSTRVFHFLRSLPTIGSVKAKNMMGELNISETRRLQGLGNRQLEELRKVCSDIPARKKDAA